YFRRPAINKENICGLDVPVHDALCVGSFEAVGNLNADVQEFGYFDGLPANAVLESLALEQLHGNERTAFELSNIVNGADVGMIEGGCSTRFATESLDSLSVLGDVLGKKFQGNTTAEPRVLSFVDHSHSAAAQFFQDAVVGDGPANNRRSIHQRPWSLPQRFNARKSDQHATRPR